MRMSYWHYEGTAHTGIARIICSMRDLHSILYAPGGDSYIYSLFTLLERSERFPPLTISVIDGRTLSRGAIRLASTLEEVYQTHRPNLIVVAGSCTAALLSQDLEAEIKEAQLPPDAAQVLLYTPNPYRVLENEAAETLLSLMTRRFATKALPPTPQPSVNIIGPTSLGFHHKHDLISLKNLLRALGLRVNLVYPLGAALEGVKELARAWVTVAPYREIGFDTAKWLEATYGIGAVTTTPIGIASTQEWMSEILENVSNFARRHGLKFENPEISPSDVLVASDLRPGSGLSDSYPKFALKQVQSLRVFIFGDFTHAVALTRFLATDLDIKVVGAGTYNRQLKVEFEEAVRPFTNQSLVTEDFEVVRKHVTVLKPDILLGSHLERQLALRLGLLFVAISSPAQIQDFSLGYEPLLGFDGAEFILSQLYRASFEVQQTTQIDLSLTEAGGELTSLAANEEAFQAGGSRLGWGELVKPPSFS